MRMSLPTIGLLLVGYATQTTLAFVTPHSSVGPVRSSSPAHMMVEASSAIVADWATMADSVAAAAATTAATDSATAVPLMDAASNMMLSFTDQGANLAGIFFQASLLPYLLFLYFLSFRANRIPALGNFGFQFVLIFVLSTIPSGILSKSVYGTSLANVDWLHGGAETLLTVANVLIVLGFKQAMTEPSDSSSSVTQPSNLNTSWTPRLLAVGIAGIFAASCATLTGSLEAHTPFLGGLGNVPEAVLYTDWSKVISHAEPSNALSIPTWAIHFSSVLEYLLAMNLVWKFAETTGQKSWKGLTWGMLPLHASGVCACTYHWFYNPPELQFLVTSQAGLTLLGNLTCMLAAYRIARSNGWTVQELVPSWATPTSPAGLVTEALAMKPLDVKPDVVPSTPILAVALVGATLALSYVTKYGELALDTPFTPNAALATTMILGIPALTALPYALESKQNDPAWSPAQYLPQFGGGSDSDGKPALSMADVKKYGVAGTVAYVLTELAFWIVAFPVAATALYKTTGHWPDVVAEPDDRTAVLAFIFAGANVARLLVPLRLGAALALAPWVDENLLSGGRQSEGTSQDEGQLMS